MKKSDVVNENGVMDEQEIPIANQLIDTVLNGSMINNNILLPPEPSTSVGLVGKRLFVPLGDPEKSAKDQEIHPSILHDGNRERRKSSPNHREKGRVSFSVGDGEKDVSEGFTSTDDRGGSSPHNREEVKRVLFYVDNGTTETESAPCLCEADLFAVNPLMNKKTMRRTRASEAPPLASAPQLRALDRSGLGSSYPRRMGETAMQKTLQAAMRQRRTSLPASALSLPKQSPVASSSILEARGLIADMLAGRDLPSNVAGALRAVAHLLTPVSIIGAANHADFGLPCVIEDPYSGEQLLVSSSSKPRVSNITFSTVTSATGLPTIAAEPNRPRSSRSDSYWRPEHVNGENGPSNEGATTQLADDIAPGTSSVFGKSEQSQQNDRRLNDTAAGTSTAGVYQTSDGTVFDVKEMEKDPLLKRVADWSFPIFDMESKHETTILTRLSLTIFRQADLFRTFRINHQKFFNYFHQLERGYWDIPYHNRVHAADVLHAVYYLSCHNVHPHIGRDGSPDSPTQHSPAPDLPVVLSKSMTDLELMALYTAAAMHDYDHPGRTNAFLVAIEDPKAIMYNDRSVLENHHAAESWRLLQKSENCFVENLDSAELKRFRYLVLEYILATDLKQHFEIIMTFNEKTTELELSNETDRVLISKMLIKLADINSPGKPYALHRQWTERICEEFYEQGDDEKRRNMQVTPYMDRQEPAVAKLQDSFISHVVSPLAVAMSEAGLLPILPGLEEPEIMINLKHNHHKWLLELDAAGSASSGVGDTIEEESSMSESPDNRNKRSLSEDSEPEIEFEMCTIQERDEEYL